MALPKINSTDVKYITQLPSMPDKNIEYRPFTVNEQKPLLMAKDSKDKHAVNVAIRDLLTACTFGSVDIDKLPIFDIEWLLLMVRSKSVGERIKISLKCDKCSHECPHEINIYEIKELVVDKIGYTKIEISDTIEAEIRYPTLKDTVDGNNEIEVAINLIAKLLVSTYNTKNEDEYALTKDEKFADVVRFVESLTSAQFEKFVEFITNIPKLSHPIKAKCEKCDNDIEHTVEGISNFFT